MEPIQVDVMAIVEVGDVPAVSMKEIVLIKPKGMALVKQLVRMEVKDTASLDAMNLGLRKINKVLKYIDMARLEATRPLRAATKQVNDQVAAKVAPIRDCFDEGDAKVKAYRAAEQKRIAAENALIAEKNRLAEEKRLAEIARREAISKAQGGDGSRIQDVPVPEPIREVAPLAATDTTSIFRHLTVEVVAVEFVPKDYLENDKVKDAIRQAVTARVQGWIKTKGGIKNVREEALPVVPGIKLGIEQRTKY